MISEPGARMASDKNDQGYEDSRFEYVVSQNFHCPICLNVLKEPVMCERNQHYFCTPCITRHLQNSSTCPSCMEELTLQTLDQVPRIVTDCVSELNIRCDYFSRGCFEWVQLGNLKSHVGICGFSPVTCSNDGCGLVVSKRDKLHHEAEVCEFRKLKCHDCVELRKKIEEIKLNLTGMKEQLDQIATLPDKIETLQDQMRHMNQMQEEMMKEVKDMMAEMKDLKYGKKNGGQTVERPLFKKRGDIIIAGGQGTIPQHSRQAEVMFMNSVEMFSWAKKSWMPLNRMITGRSEASSFVYENQMFIAGGWTRRHWTDSMEKINIRDVSARWIDFPAKLPVDLWRPKVVCYKDRLFITAATYTEGHIYELLLIPRYSVKLLSKLPRPVHYHGMECLNGTIFTVGGQHPAVMGSHDNVFMYDITKDECKQMAPLPFAVSCMATVTWRNNLLVIGGEDEDGKVLNSVLMYDVTTGESTVLPTMNYRRKGCSAVITEDVIVVMGGYDEDKNYLNAVECFSFDRQVWEELPPMITRRAYAAAVAK